MLIEEIVAVGLIGILVGVFFIVRGTTRRPKQTKDDLTLAIEAYVEIKNELQHELKLQRELSREMMSTLMLSSGQGAILTAGEEHDLHVDAEMNRRREACNIQQGLRRDR